MIFEKLSCIPQMEEEEYVLGRSGTPTLVPNAPRKKPSSAKKLEYSSSLEIIENGTSKDPKISFSARARKAVLLTDVKRKKEDDNLDISQFRSGQVVDESGSEDEPEPPPNPNPNGNDGNADGAGDGSPPEAAGAAAEEGPTRAPNELLMEFVDCLLQRDYSTADKLCRMILMFEPDNPEALQFRPLIVERLRMEEEGMFQSSSEDEDSEEDSDSDEDSDDDDEEEEEEEGAKNDPKTAVGSAPSNHGHSCSKSHK